MAAVFTLFADDCVFLQGRCHKRCSQVSVLNLARTTRGELRRIRACVTAERVVCGEHKGLSRATVARWHCYV